MTVMKTETLWVLLRWWQGNIVLKFLLIFLVSKISTMAWYSILNLISTVNQISIFHATIVTDKSISYFDQKMFGCVLHHEWQYVLHLCLQPNFKTIFPCHHLNKTHKVSVFITAVSPRDPNYVGNVCKIPNRIR